MAKLPEQFRNLKLSSQIVLVSAGFVVLIVVLSLGHVFALSPAHGQDCSKTNFQTFKINISDRFDPNEVHAHICDKLIFTAIDNSLHWPAAGPHPSHESYPGFDAGHALRAGESFEFTLTKSGAYSFHDHLHEQIIGSIVIDR